MITAELRLQVDKDPPDYAHKLGFFLKRNTLFFKHLRLNKCIKQKKHTISKQKSFWKPNVPLKVGKKRKQLKVESLLWEVVTKKM